VANSSESGHRWHFPASATENIFCMLNIWLSWTNCAFGLYPSSGVSRTNKIEDKVQKHNSFNTNTPSSESYRNYIRLSARLGFSQQYRFKLSSSGLWQCIVWWYGTNVLEDLTASTFWVHFILKMEGARSSETLISYHNTTW